MARQCPSRMLVKLIFFPCLMIMLFKTVGNNFGRNDVEAFAIVGNNGVHEIRYEKKLSSSTGSLHFSSSNDVGDLHQDHIDHVDYDIDPDDETSNGVIIKKFLGKGPDAIVREGCVLVAPADEFHHYLREAAVYVYAIGTDDSGGGCVIRGVIIDNPTPFKMSEMMEKDENNESSIRRTGVYDNLIFRGGDTGGENAFCFHSDETLRLEEIGSSGLYQGGDPEKVKNPDAVKFFFNYMEFTESELEDMLSVTYGDDDYWMTVEVPPDVVLNSNYDRGECWSLLRNSIRRIKK